MRRLTQLHFSVLQCDRRYPECSRCLKRKEGCDYGDDVSIVRFASSAVFSLPHSHPLLAQALRPTWVIPGEHDDLVSNPSLQHPSYVAPRSAFASSSSHPYLPRPSNPPTFDSSRSLRTISNGEIQQALTVAGKTGNVAEETQEEEGFTKLWEGFLSASNLGASSSDWRLAVPTMAASLQVHLIEGAFPSLFARPFSPILQFILRLNTDATFLQPRCTPAAPTYQPSTPSPPKSTTSSTSSLAPAISTSPPKSSSLSSPPSAPAPPPTPPSSASPVPT